MNARLLLQSKSGSHVEVHSIRGSQVILRARVPTRRDQGPSGLKSKGSAAEPTHSLPVSRVGSFKADKINTKPYLHRSLSDTLYRSCSVLKLRGRCQLIEQSMDILEKILKFLNSRDLAMLSLTSKTLNFVVRTYVSHQCDRFNLRGQVDHFFEINKSSLLPKEFALKERLKVNSRPMLLLYSTGSHYLGTIKTLGLSFCID